MFLYCIGLPCVLLFKLGVLYRKKSPALTLKLFSAFGSVFYAGWLVQHFIYIVVRFFVWRPILLYYVALYFCFEHSWIGRVHISRIFFFNNDDIGRGNYSTTTGKISRYYWYFRFLLGCSSLFCLLDLLCS